MKKPQCARCYIWPCYNGSVKRCRAALSERSGEGLLYVRRSVMPRKPKHPCGYPGCPELAAALVSGEETKVTKCKVGNKEKNFIPIINYLKEHPGEDGNSHVPSL